MKKFDTILDKIHRAKMTGGLSITEGWLLNLVADIEEASIEIASEIESLTSEIRSLEYENENLQQDVYELSCEIADLEEEISDLKELRNE